jgi:hypothetical protein
MILELLMARLDATREAGKCSPKMTSGRLKQQKFTKETEKNKAVQQDSVY